MTQLRLYRADDRAAVCGIFYDAVHVGAAAFYTEAQRQAWAPRRAPDLSKPDKLLDQHCILAEQDGRVVGFMSLCDDGYLDMAFVHPDVQGQGVAAQIYGALLQHAQRQRQTCLTTHASHLARRFFEKQGWRVTAPELHPHNGQEFERFAMTLDPVPPASKG